MITNFQVTEKLGLLIAPTSPKIIKFTEFKVTKSTWIRNDEYFGILRKNARQ